MRLSVILLAAGSSRRAGCDKLYISLGQKPALVMALEAFLKYEHTHEVIVVSRADRVEANREQLGRLGKIFGIRYAVAAILAVIFYFILPFELEIRQALVLLVFSPVGSAVLAFTGELKSDVGLSSAINSVSMMISIPIIVVLLIVML